MKMYIANCTQQNQDFHYRLPGTNGVRKQLIEIGTQLLISGNLSTPDINAIAEQGAVYGLVREDDVDRTKAFVGMCYQIDKPVSISRIRIALNHNVEVLEDRGREQRKEAAVVISNEMNKSEGLKQTDVSIVEEERPGHDAKFAEGFTVKNEEQERTKAPTNKKKKR